MVSDYRGQLYNKEAILELLVDPKPYSDKQRELVSHITSLKDVVQLKLTEQDDHFVCPITGNTLGSNGIKYVYLVRCHCVFAEKCLREISPKEKTCPLCSTTFEADDVIVINPSTEDLKKLQTRMDTLTKSGLPHSLSVKKSKKKKSGDKKKRQAEDEDKDQQQSLSKKQHN